jgi:putative membrane protein
VFPINRVPDEMNHARMTWETLHKPTETSFKWMDEIPSNDKVKPREYKQLLARKIEMKNEPFRFGISLKTISFIPQLIGMTIGSWISPTVGMIIYMGRISNALAYILGLYFLIRYFKYGKTALMFISLLPIMIQQASSLSYDVMNYLEVMLALGFITNLAYSKRFTNRNFVQVIGLAILLLATKPNNILLLGLIPFIPFEFKGVLKVLNRPFKSLKLIVSRYKFVFYLLLLITIGFVLQFLMRNEGGFFHYIHVLLNTLVDAKQNGDLNSILTIGIFGFLGNFTLQLPLWLIFVDVAVLFLIFLAEKKDFFSKDFSILAALLFPIQVIATVTVMYLQWTPIVLGHGASISVGSQGRYFTPFLILFLPLVANLGNFEISQNKVLKISTVTLLVNYLISIFLIIPYYWM